MDAIKNAANSASETVQQGVSGVSKEGNKQVAKDSNADTSTRAEAGKDAIGDKVSETTHSVSYRPHGTSEHMKLRVPQVKK